MSRMLRKDKKKKKNIFKPQYILVTGERRDAGENSSDVTDNRLMKVSQEDKSVLCTEASM